jgi:hypothetical protein
MPNHCSHCGVLLAWATRRCARCGARLPDPVSSALGIGRRANQSQPPRSDTWADHAPPEATHDAAGTREVRTRRARLAARGWWAESRHRTSVAIAVCGLVLGLAVGLAFAVGNPTVEPNRVAPAPAPRRHPHRLAAGAWPVPPAQPAQLAELAYLNQLESILQQAAVGRTVLTAALRGAPGSCQLPLATAAVAVHAVVLNRTHLLYGLGALPSAPNAETQPLEPLLAAALRVSSQAESEYEAWLDTNGVAGLESCSDRSSPATALFWNSARASDSTATTAKVTFVTAFNPVAARFSLPIWAETQF